MSVPIDVDNVEQVLIAGQWHNVSGNSFTVGAYEYIWHASQDNRRRGVPPESLLQAGEHDICPVAFVFRTDGDRFMCGPLTAVDAVLTRPA